MMPQTVRFITVGNLKESYLRDAAAEYNNFHICIHLHPKAAAVRSDGRCPVFQFIFSSSQSVFSVFSISVLRFLYA